MTERETTLSHNIVDLQAVMELVAARRHEDLPYREINFNGKIYNCLCDSGACRTVLKTPPPRHTHSDVLLSVRSASGEANLRALSRPIEVTDCTFRRNVPKPYPSEQRLPHQPPGKRCDEETRHMHMHRGAGGLFHDAEKRNPSLLLDFGPGTSTNG